MKFALVTAIIHATTTFGPAVAAGNVRRNIGGHGDRVLQDDASSCGGPGDACCYHPSGGGPKSSSSTSSSSSSDSKEGKSKSGKHLCYPGLGCNFADSSDYGVCTAQCGGKNEPCCESLCVSDACRCECGPGLVFDISEKLCVPCGDLGQPCCCDSSGYEAYRNLFETPVDPNIADIMKLGECVSGCPGRPGLFCGSGGKCACKGGPITSEQCSAYEYVYYSTNDLTGSSGSLSWNTAYENTPQNCVMAPIHDENELNAVSLAIPGDKTETWVGLYKWQEDTEEDGSSAMNRVVRAYGWLNLDGTRLASNDSAADPVDCGSNKCWPSVSVVNKYWTGTEPNNSNVPQTRATINRNSDGKLRDVRRDNTQADGVVYYCCMETTSSTTC